MEDNKLNQQKKKEYWLKTARTFNQVPKVVPFGTLGDRTPKSWSVPVSEETAQLLTKVGKGQALQTYILLLAGYALTARRYTRQSHIGWVSPVVQKGGAYSSTQGLHFHQLEVELSQAGLELLKQIQGTVFSGIENDYPAYDQLWQDITALDEDFLEHLTHIGIGYSALHERPAAFDGLETTVTLEKTDSGFTFQVTGHGEDQHWFLTQFVGHWDFLLGQLLQNPKQNLQDYTWIQPAEIQMLLEEYSGVDAVPPYFDTITGFIHDSAQKNPDRIALEGTSEITYRDLDLWSDRIATWLQNEQQVKSGDRVGLLLQRDEYMIVWIVAVLKAGAAYVPFDPMYPADRIGMILEEAQPTVCVVSEGIDILNDKATVPLLPAQSSFDIAHRIEGTPTGAPKTDDLAYIIYTSGSTGRPKGVMITHSNVAYLQHWGRDEFSHLNANKIYCTSSISFDISVFEIFGGLALGTTLRILGNILDAPEALKTDTNVMLCCVPSSTVQLLRTDTNWDAVAAITMAGEPMPQSVMEDLDCDAIEVRNAYGPTEDTVYDACLKLSNDLDRVRIGPPFPGHRMYILDEQMQLVPTGVDGELYISGVGVSPGYYRRDDLTEKVYLDHPFRSGEKLYRTGDLMRWLPGGHLESRGRLDFQVKVRGFRVELGEIEIRMLELDAVKEAIVLAKKDDQNVTYLVGYVVSKTLTDSEPIRAHLENNLPGYMVPSYLVVMEEFPYMPNGKINRKALPEPEEEAGDSTPYVAPADELEEKLLDLFKDVTQRDKIGVLHNFFALGGHSLKAFQLMKRVSKELGYNVTAPQIFQNPTVRDLADYIRSTHVGAQEAEAESILDELQRVGIQVKPDPAGGITITVGTERLSEQLHKRLVAASEAIRGLWRKPGSLVHVPDADHYPVSNSQKRLWILHQLNETGSAYNITAGYRIKGNLDVEAFRKALNWVVDRHEILRTTFITVNGEPRQAVHPTGSYVIPLEQISATADTVEDTLNRMNTSLAYDLENGPLFKAVLATLDKDEYLFTLMMHHTISDGWSTEVLARDLGIAYQAYHQGKRPRIPALPLQFRDFATWESNQLQGPKLDLLTQFWAGRFEGELPILELPHDKPRPKVKTANGGILDVKLPTNLQAQVRQLIVQQETTLFAMTIAATYAWLSRITYQNDFILGTPVAGRHVPELHNQVGFYANTVALREQVQGSESFVQLLKRVQTHVQAAFEHQVYPFDRLVEDLRIERDPARSPLFDFMVTTSEAGGFLAETPEDEVSELEISNADVHGNTSQFDLSLDYFAQGKEGRLVWVYNSDLFSEERMRELSGFFVTLLGQMVADPNKTIGTHTLLGEAEKKALIQEYQPSPVTYPHQTVWSAIAASAQQQPDAVALWCKGRTLTYGQLLSQANTMAAWLHQTYNLNPGDRVGLCTPRSEESILALFALIRAGVTFVPIDPIYPQERIDFLTENSECTLVVVEQGAQEGTLALSAWIDASSAMSSQESHTLPEPQGQDLAYILYTSGTTGKPKGVMITHHALADYAQSFSSVIHLQSSDVVLQQASLSFDTAMEEIFGALCKGTTLAIAPQGGRDIQDMIQVIQEAKVSVISTTPLVVEQLNEQAGNLPTVRALVSGGDELRHSQISNWFNCATVYNSYGPTETTVAATFYEVTPDSTEGVIGKPMVNREIYLLNEEMEPVPKGVPGEICLAGPGLAQGYWKRPEETAKAFVTNPHKPEEKLYRTGDLGVMLADGNIKFLGRKDKQTKIMGYRVELSGIEAALNLHPSVVACAVRAKQPATGSKYLCAYYVTQGDETIIEDDLRTFLSERVPFYMVPRFFMALDTMPQTANGKLDERALPEPNTSEARKYVAPRTEEEKGLAKIWEDILGTQAGAADHFFQLGGNSLKATQLIARVNQEFSVTLGLAEIFERPSLEKQAEKIALVRQLSQSNDENEQEDDLETLTI